MTAHPPCPPADGALQPCPLALNNRLFDLWRMNVLITFFNTCRWLDKPAFSYCLWRTTGHWRFDCCASGEQRSPSAGRLRWGKPGGFYSCSTAPPTGHPGYRIIFTNINTAARQQFITVVVSSTGNSGKEKKYVFKSIKQTTISRNDRMFLFDLYHR